MPRVVVQRRFEFEQTIPAATWTIVHNLGVVNPIVDVWVYSGGTGPLTQATPTTIHSTDLTTSTITFATPQIGVVLIT